MSSVRAVSGAMALAVTLAALSCIVVEHSYDPSFSCSPETRPACCEFCGGSRLVEPECSPGGWTCPPGSVSSRMCPNGNFCRVGDAGGGCGDGGSSQASYTFPGCFPGTYLCPNDVTLGCAFSTLQAVHGACRFSTDCVEADLDGGCSGHGGCIPYAVNAAQRDEFLRLAQAEVDQYCACPTCNAPRVCGVNRDAGAPRCVSGRCAWLDRTVTLACASPAQGTCSSICAEDEACFTQMACPPGGDGGCALQDAGPGSPPGDHLCHRRCAPDGGGCPAGEACFQVAFYGCGDGSAPEVAPICCRADGGCR